MTDREKELLRLVEVDYEKTIALAEGVVGSGFTIRGWAITLTSALIGIAFQSHVPEIALLAAVLTPLFALIDSYHSWLYASTMTHAGKIETVLAAYYSFLAREGDKDAKLSFEKALLSHTFGRFADTERFGFRSFREARPRLVLVVLYAALLVCAIGSACLIVSKPETPALSTPVLTRGAEPRK